MSLLVDLKAACGTAHELGRRQLPKPWVRECVLRSLGQSVFSRTWGTIVPGVFAGSDEDMDDVLAILVRCPKYRSLHPAS